MSRVSEPAGRSAREPTWKSALQQVWKPALRCFGGSAPTCAAAFTLVEVMVATAVFFMAMFAILGVLSSGIHAAVILRSTGPTAGMVAANYYVTNQIEEGEVRGDFSDIAGYDKYTWTSTAVEVATNGLYRMDIVVKDPNDNPCSFVSLLLYKTSTGSQRMGLQPQR